MGPRRAPTLLEWHRRGLFQPFGPVRYRILGCRGSRCSEPYSKVLLKWVCAVSASRLAGVHTPRYSGVMTPRPSMCVTAQSLSAPRWLKSISGKYVVTDTGCWQWVGRVNNTGYGRAQVYLRRRYRFTGAHRASWMAHRGPIPPGLALDHLCRNRLCINPDHLEPVTPKENTRRGAESNPDFHRKPRPLGERPTCKHHGDVDGRWYTKPAGKYPYWQCNVCHRHRLRIFRARRRRELSSVPAPEEPHTQNE